MKDKAKRLTPKIQVLRELYMKSGNQCAFPGCNKSMIDEYGNFVGQVCHIEAAEKGGERFNPNMTNEERRAYDNLMLMCYEHHIATNDVSKYSVDDLKTMKRNHEEKFSGIIQNMQNSIVDYSYDSNYLETKTCRTFSTVLQYNTSDDENIENAKILNSLMMRLVHLPIDTRMVLGIMVRRSYQDQMDNCIIPLHEVEKATGKSSNYFLPHIEILSRRGIITEVKVDELGCPFCCLYGDRETGWSYWNDIRDFCEKTGTSLERICVDLNFSVFD